MAIAFYNHRKLILAEEQIGELSMGLDDVDKRVVDLKEQLNTNTKEAVEIEISLNKAKETLAAAEGLVMKLDEEYLRWKEQVNIVDNSLSSPLIPNVIITLKWYLLYSGFIML